MLDNMTTVEIPTGDAHPMPAYLARPSGEPRSVGVIVAHELFGVNSDIQAVVDGLAAEGYLTVAPEFYHRHAAPGRWLERNDAGRADGFALLHTITRADAVKDVDDAREWLLKQPGIEQVAIVGFSAGGHLSYLAATQLPIDRVVVLYGGWLNSTAIPLSQPTPTLDLTNGITGQVLYLVGADDTLITPGDVDEISAALKQHHIDHEVVTYPAVGHAFFWPDTPAYDSDARDDAWKRILGLLSS